jgi:hypothetical protein
MLATFAHGDRGSLGEIKYWHNFTIKWVHQIFTVLVKIESTLHLNQSSFQPSADVKPMANDLVHVMP